MKEFLRRWLEIPDIQKERDIRKMVADAVFEAISTNGSDRTNMYWNINNGIRGLFRKRIQYVSCEFISKNAENKLNELIEDSNFIESIVSKINRNQLKADK